MELNKKLEMLCEVFEVEEGEISAETELKEIESWDSLTKLSLIVRMSDEFGKTLSGEQVRSFKTVQDILDIMN